MKFQTTLSHCAGIFGFLAKSESVRYNITVLCTITMLGKSHFENMSLNHVKTQVS